MTFHTAVILQGIKMQKVKKQNDAKVGYTDHQNEFCSSF